jgi:hypothetical protein
MTFPKLRYLSLTSFTVENPAQAMAFWERHPSLEFLNVFDSNGETSWFSRDPVLPVGFLPNLKHLKVHYLITEDKTFQLISLQAHFNDVRTLAPILSQLASLTIFGSINAQIPYLLRSVLTEGLPNLKSLNIGQQFSSSGKNINIEGALWYETEDGEFRQAKVTKAAKTVLDGYMHSITRGAPNLEEIGFHSYPLRLRDFVSSTSRSIKMCSRYPSGQGMCPKLLVFPSFADSI